MRLAAVANAVVMAPGPPTMAMMVPAAMVVPAATAMARPLRIAVIAMAHATHVLVAVGHCAIHSIVMVGGHLRQHGGREADRSADQNRGRDTRNRHLHCPRWWWRQNVPKLAWVRANLGRRRGQALFGGSTSAEYRSHPRHDDVAVDKLVFQRGADVKHDQRIGKIGEDAMGLADGVP